MGVSPAPNGPTAGTTTGAAGTTVTVSRLGPGVPAPDNGNLLEVADGRECRVLYHGETGNRAQNAGALPGPWKVEFTGDGTVADMLWARPALTVLGIDVPPVVGSAGAAPHHRRGRAACRPCRHRS